MTHFPTNLDIAAITAPNKRIAGLDVGSKTIGVAVSDTSHTIATPFKLINRKKLAGDIEELKKIMTEKNISAVVIGLPVNMDGTEGAMCQSVRQFGANIEPHIALPVIFWDERMTTMAAMRALSDFDISQDKKQEKVDQVAASYILQGFLDWLKNQKNKAM